MPSLQRVHNDAKAKSKHFIPHLLCRHVSMDKSCSFFSGASYLPSSTDVITQQKIILERLERLLQTVVTKYICCFLFLKFQARQGELTMTANLSEPGYSFVLASSIPPVNPVS